MLKTQLPFIDFYCTKEMLLELDETPRIDMYEDRHLSPSMEKFYSVLGVLLVIVVILSVCLFLAKKKLKRLISSLRVI